METTGRIKGITKDWQTDKLILSIEIDSLPSDLEELMGYDTLDVIAKRHRVKRSLNANAYYWEMVGKLSAKLNVSFAELHNRFLRENPVPLGWFADVPDTDEAEEIVNKSMKFHLMPTSRVWEGKNGVTYRSYMVIKGSSEYDTKEMSILIENMIAECKAQGIETLPPEEIERMKSLWTGKDY